MENNKQIHIFTKFFHYHFRIHAHLNNHLYKKETHPSQYSVKNAFLLYIIRFKIITLFGRRIEDIQINLLCSNSRLTQKGRTNALYFRGRRVILCSEQELMQCGYIRCQICRNKYGTLCICCDWCLCHRESDSIT